MFSNKAHLVKELFNTEINRIKGDYDELKNMLCFYEGKIK